MTEETTTEAPYTNQQIAENTVKELSANDLTKEFQRLLDEVEYYKKDTKLAKERATQANSRYSNLFTSIEEFIKEHVKEEQVQIDNLKDFAKEIGLELTKSIKVTFIAECEYEFTVPLDYDIDDITESDFVTNISSHITDEGVEETHESIEIKEFEVEDND
jgi:outer membrane murein-binding lipoprotein Lpp